MRPEFGFQEHAHTADWELEVWAPDLPGLLEQAAIGMYTLSGVKLTESPPIQDALILNAPDIESLLVQFLTDLLWLEESKGVAFNKFDFALMEDNEFHINAKVTGSAIQSLDKEIKAVTYHNLAVKTTSKGLWVTIVFDV
jgi:protein archease